MIGTRTMLLFASQRLPRRRQTRFAAVALRRQLDRWVRSCRVAIGATTGGGGRIGRHVCFGAIRRKRATGQRRALVAFEFSTRVVTRRIRLGKSWRRGVKGYYDDAVGKSAKDPKPPQVGGVYRRSDPARSSVVFETKLGRVPSVEISLKE